ncbi:poly-gamma-glutamate hydrolase family protein [Nonomuraea sp. NPDC050643]|uniref:poly-gamma-glutamate hydrolase family protein n=1 Tax=Nonomuraea sp. NPDC050643 TaxID=3155660 RepID=UPI00340588F3
MPTVITRVATTRTATRASTRVAAVALAASAAFVPVPASADTYENYADLAAHEVEGTDYRRVLRTPSGAEVSHLAIHGGAIEGGTSPLADHAAGSGGHAFYAFEGIKSTGNGVLHITASNFDEPKALSLQSKVFRTVSWHGASGTHATTYVGGRDEALVTKVKAALDAAGFAVAEVVPPGLAGTDPLNIANRNRTGMGVQLEITEAQRKRFFQDGKLNRAWTEDRTHWTPELFAYVAAVNDALQQP